jgi:hypothetical protein
MTIKTFKAGGKILSTFEYTYYNREKEDIAYLLLEDKSTPTQDSTKAVDTDVEISEFINLETPKIDEEEEGRERKRRRFTPYQTMAVKPSSAVVPMLHNLLNPFVMGISKAARQVGPSINPGSMG